MSETPVQSGEDGGRRHGEAGIDLVVLRVPVATTSLRVTTRRLSCADTVRTEKNRKDRYSLRMKVRVLSGYAGG